MITKDKGITLVALVITIIVLLILAGITIAMTLGENGILANAKKAKTDTEKAAENEDTELSKAKSRIDEELNGNSSGEETAQNYIIYNKDSDTGFDSSKFNAYDITPTYTEGKLTFSSNNGQNGYIVLKEKLNLENYSKAVVRGKRTNNQSDYKHFWVRIKDNNDPTDAYARLNNRVFANPNEEFELEVDIPRLVKEGYPCIGMCSGDIEIYSWELVTDGASSRKQPNSNTHYIFEEGLTGFNMLDFTPYDVTESLSNEKLTLSSNSGQNGYITSKEKIDFSNYNKMILTGKRTNNATEYKQVWLRVKSDSTTSNNNFVLSTDAVFPGQNEEFELELDLSEFNDEGYPSIMFCWGDLDIYSWRLE